jgi:hypothetical protein
MVRYKYLFVGTFYYTFVYYTTPEHNRRYLSCTSYPPDFQRVAQNTYQPEWLGKGKANAR